MLEYPQKAQAALRLLFRRYNDIEVYVEDRRYLGIYKTIVARALGGKARIGTVFSLGNRESVIAECKKADWNDGTRKLYIIDADFDLLLDKPAPKIKGLHRLDAYCIENLLIDIDALESVADDLVDEKNIDDVRKSLKLAIFLRDVAAELVPLFVLYAIVHEHSSAHALGVETAGRHVFKMCIQANGRKSLSKPQCQALATSIRQTLEGALGKTAVDREVREIEKRVKACAQHGLSFVSAKTYTLPLVIEHVRRYVASIGSVAAVRSLLSERIDLAKHSRLVRRIKRTAAGLA
jgi:hypothetical protein